MHHLFYIIFDYGKLIAYSNFILHINESLCSHYHHLWSKCKALWKEKEIHGFFVSNGNIKIRKEEGGRVDTIGHISELIKKFPDSKVFDGENDSGY